MFFCGDHDCVRYTVMLRKGRCTEMAIVNSRQNALDELEAKARQHSIQFSSIKVRHERPIEKGGWHKLSLYNDGGEPLISVQFRPTVCDY